MSSNNILVFSLVLILSTTLTFSAPFFTGGFTKEINQICKAFSNPSLCKMVLHRYPEFGEPTSLTNVCSIGIRAADAYASKVYLALGPKKPVKYQECFEDYNVILEEIGQATLSIDMHDFKAVMNETTTAVDRSGKCADRLGERDSLGVRSRNVAQLSDIARQCAIYLNGTMHH